MRSRFTLSRLSLLLSLSAPLLCAYLHPRPIAQTVDVTPKATSLPGGQAPHSVSSPVVTALLAQQKPQTEEQEKQPETKQISYRNETLYSYHDGAFYRQGKRVMLVYSDTNIHYVELWETKTGRHLATLKGRDPIPEREFNLVAAAITPDGTRVFLAGLSIDGFIALDVPHKYTIWDGSEIDWNGGDPFGLAVSPNGKYLLFMQHFRTKLLSTATGKLVRVLLQLSDTGQDYPGPSAFSPDGKYAAITNGSEDLILISAVPSGSQLQKFRSRNVVDVLFSPDDRYLLTLSSQSHMPPHATIYEANIVRLWDWRTGKLVREFKLPVQKGMNQVAFTPDGKQLLANGSPMTVWDVRTGREVRQFSKRPPYNGVGEFCVSPDGRYVLSIDDGTLWRLATGKFVRAFRLPDP